MEQYIFIQEYFKIIQHLYQLKTLNIFVALLKLIHRDLMEFQKKIITKSDINYVPYFVDYHVLPDTMDTV